MLANLKKVAVAALVCASVFVFPVVAKAEPAATTARQSVLMLGDRDESVRELQEILAQKGYLTVNPTGYYGTDTQAAVIKYQTDNGLSPDGKAGPVTRKSIMGKAYQQIVLSASAASSGPRYNDASLLRVGSQGADVTKLQKKLKELGYYTYSAYTGYFGNITKSAVLDFQVNNGLSADGIAGSKTQTLLYSGKAKKAPAKQNNSSQSSAAKKGQQTVEIAKKSLGKKYAWGGNGPDSFDCSGLVVYVLKQQGQYSLRNSYEMSKYTSWPSVQWKNLRAGDLMFFDTRTDGSVPVGHVGIYIGSGQMIHASTSAGKVVISGVTSGYFKERFVNARRVFYD